MTNRRTTGLVEYYYVLNEKKISLLTACIQLKEEIEKYQNILKNKRCFQDVETKDVFSHLRMLHYNKMLNTYALRKIYKAERENIYDKNLISDTYLLRTSYEEAERNNCMKKITDFLMSNCC